MGPYLSLFFGANFAPRPRHGTSGENWCQERLSQALYYRLEPWDAKENNMRDWYIYLDEWLTSKK